MSLQLKISASYMAILLIVLVLMNTYPLLVSQDLVFRAKHTTLQSSAAAINAAVSGLSELTEENVAQAMAQVAQAEICCGVIEHFACVTSTVTILVAVAEIGVFREI